MARTSWIHALAIAPMLLEGVPDGATARVAFESNDGRKPSFGEVPNATYAFGAVARDETCTVLATGCTEANIGDTDFVKIPLASKEHGAQCASGTTCQAGRCIPASDDANPSVGTHCSLELLGSGPLGRPVGIEDGVDTLVSAPAIVPTSAGFVLAYRRMNPRTRETHLITMAIDTSGGVHLRPEDVHGGISPLPDRCGSADENDGVGLALTGDTLRLILARPACADKPALELLEYGFTNDDNGLPMPSLRSKVFSPSSSDTKPILSSARSTTGRPTGDVVVTTEGGTALIRGIDSSKGFGGPSGTFGGRSGITGAWVSANDTILALLAAGPPISSPLLDAGSGSEDGGPAAPASTPTPALRLLVLPSDTSIDTLDAEKETPRAPITIAGTFGSLATVLGRAIVVSDSTDEGIDLSLRAYDLGSDNLADHTDVGVGGEGKATAADVAVVENRAYVAAIKPHTVELHVYDNATTTMTPLRDVSFDRVPRISAINIVRDGRVAVAATATRVAVAWTTSTSLDENDSAGGYAVFACTK